MNKVLIIGRLTRDPEIRYSQGDNATSIGRISLAVDRRFKQEGQPTSDFINCLAFGKKAEFLEKYCQKGTKLVIEGSWKTGSYTNKDGVKVYTNECLIENCEFAESKNASGSNNGGGNAGPVQNNSGGDFMRIPDGIEDELPFS